MLVRYMFVLIIGLSLLLPTLGYQVGKQRQELKRMDGERRILLQESRLRSQTYKKWQAAVSFMAEAQIFVNKAQSIGIQQGSVNSYKVDFHQVVETGRIPLLLFPLITPAKFSKPKLGL